ncbi:MAG: carbon storage regulator CsrA [Sporomusaceae bacterium]|nr:carbon storage regulator CsrA [Sporomusaceae bacterium]
MLALTRKIGERLVIGDNIVVTIVDIKGDNIRLGIEAPRDIKIYRGEIYDAIVAENKQAVIPADQKTMSFLKNMNPTKK